MWHNTLLAWFTTLLAGIIGLALGGCFGTLRYACDDADQCRRSGDQGWCEASGYCSFADAECDSGRRYTGFARASLADACVGTADDDDAASDGSSEGGPATDDGFAGRCGDGIVSPPEACDDGDDRNGNGCNVDCQESGRELWTAGFDDDADVRLRGLATRDGIVAVTGVVGSDEGSAIVVATYDDDGDQTWSVDFGAVDFGASMTADDGGQAVAVAPGGDVVVVATLTSAEAFDTAIAVWRLDGEGEERWSLGFDTLSADAALAAGVDADGDAIVAGHTQDAAWIRKITTDGVAAWTRTDLGPAGTPSAFVAIDVAPGGGFAGVGTSAGQGWITRYGPDGGLLASFAASPATLAPHGVALTGTGVAVSGLDGAVGRLTIYEASGAVTRAVDTPGPPGQTLSLAADRTGDLVAAGSTGPGVWLTKFDAAGDMLWSQVIDLDGGGDPDAAVAVSVDNDDSIYVATSAVSEGTIRGWLGKYAP